MDSLRKAMFPLFFVLSIFGLGVFEYPYGHRRIYITCLYILMSWIVYAFLIRHLILVYSFGVEGFTMTILVFVIFNVITTAASGITCIFCSKECNECLRKFDMIDDTLEKLGVRKEYKKIRKLSVYIIVGWIIIIQLLNNTCLMAVRDSIPCPEIYYVSNHFGHVNTLLDLKFVILSRCAESRFRRLNDYIRRLYEQNLQHIRARNLLVRVDAVVTPINHTTIIPASLENHDLWIIMHLHLELCKICNRLNRAFEVPMVLEMLTYFVFIIGLIYRVYIVLATDTSILADKKAGFLVDAFVWGTFYVSKLFLINYICEAVSLEANKTQENIHRLMDPMRLEIREEVFQFLYQIEYKRLKFTAIGCYFGYSFVKSFFGTITTFLIILLQMTADNSNRVKS